MRYAAAYKLGSEPLDQFIKGRGRHQRLRSPVLSVLGTKGFGQNRRIGCTAVSEVMGHLQTHAVQRTSAPARAIVPLQPSL
jgi:hypothetical protein